MHRTILLLNVIVLVVNFVLSLSATDSQIGLMRSTSGIANRVTWQGGGPHRADSLAYLRIVQSLQGVGPAGQSLSTEQLEAVHEALDRYRRVIDGGVVRILLGEDDSEQARRPFDVLGKQAREEVEYLLAATFQDPALVSRLTTEIIRQAR
ncbi:MAG: hypothetical protein ACYSUM_16370 [Planctomycetota bacterium]|jgi:hypothetical protein